MLAAIALIAASCAREVVRDPTQLVQTVSGDVPLNSRPAGRGLSYAEDVLKDWISLPYQFVSDPWIYEVGDYSSPLTTVKDQERRTKAPPSCECRTLTVWFSGSSSAWGFGQRDDHTIASELVDIAAQHGIALTIHNIAVPGWTLWQEYQYLQSRLASEPAPDLVIFFDGFNDVLHSMEEAIGVGADWTKPSVNDPREQPLPAVVYRFLPALEVRSRFRQQGGPETVGQLIGVRFARLGIEIKADLTARGIDTAFFVQPDALASPSQRDGTRYLGVGVGDEGSVAFQKNHFNPLYKVLDAASEQLPDDVHNLRHVFDDYERPVFFDVVHNNEEGAAIVADAIWDATKTQIQNRSRPPR